LPQELQVVKISYLINEFYILQGKSKKLICTLNTQLGKGKSDRGITSMSKTYRSHRCPVSQPRVSDIEQISQIASALQLGVEIRCARSKASPFLLIIPEASRAGTER